MIVLYIALVLLMVPFVYNAVVSRRVYGVSWRTYHAFSWPSQQVLKERRSLPKENRGDDLLPLLYALDVKYGGRSTINSNFGYSDYSGSIGYRWAVCRYGCGSSCVHKDYRGLYDEFAGIKSALQEQQQALAVAGVSHSLTDLEAIKERLREERDIIQSTTKEIS